MDSGYRNSYDKKFTTQYMKIQKEKLIHLLISIKHLIFQDP